MLQQFDDPAVRRSPKMDALVRDAVFGNEDTKTQARWMLWEIGQRAGVRPASIHELYMARGRGDVPAFTTPAMNVRILSYDTGRAIFRAAKRLDAGAIICEIARSEIAYTDQRPAAELTKFIRDREPDDVTSSVGAEIGEVGGKNSAVHELRAFMEGYNRTLQKLGTAPGISKISVQTGTSHGGVVLPDGSIAKVQLDLQALKALSHDARTKYGLGGAVQHGASTLPPEAFSQFPECEAVEIHLATNFQTMVMDHPALPKDLRGEVNEWVKREAKEEWKKGDTEEQFIYKSRKKAIGPFKRRFLDLPADVRAAIGADLEKSFAFLFEQLRVKGTRAATDRYVKPKLVSHAAPRGALVAAPDDAEAGE